MPIVKPFLAGRRFVSTAGAGTVNVNDLDFANTDFTNDTGGVSTFPASFAYINLYINGTLQTSDTLTGVTTTTATIVGGSALDSATPITLEFIVN